MSGWCPNVCPITRLPFFMWIDHPQIGNVPTYGGPFDSYTIPEPLEDEHFDSVDEISYYRHRFDHDTGEWFDGMEAVGYRVIDEDVLNKLTDAAILATEPPAVSVKAGWVAKDYFGVHWFEKRPVWIGEWQQGEQIGEWAQSVSDIGGAITDHWETSHPNGGPECLLEVKP